MISPLPPHPCGLIIDAMCAMTTQKTPKYVFGPVPSRRLGRSLGVDLVPFKTCTFDCVYCQLGRTTDKTVQRKPYLSINDVILELKERLTTPNIDYVTLSGSGEPTLHSQLGEVIARIKRITHIPVAVLTNGALFSDRDVRRDCVLADVVLPTLTAANATFFTRIHRPPPDIAFPAVLEGLYAFRKEFGGQLWVEVFLVQGINDSPAHILRLKEIIAQLEPHRIHLNTVVRPPADKDVVAVPLERMRQIKDLLGPAAEVISDPPASGVQLHPNTRMEDVLALLRRRPCTISDIASGLSIHTQEAIKYVELLRANKLVEISLVSGRQYYVARP